MKTGDPCLNSIATSFPRGFALAVGILVNSFLATGKNLQEVLRGEEIVTIHGHKISAASEPLGEPITDIQKAMIDRNWKMYVWVFQNVSPLRTMLPLQNENGGSTWTKIALPEGESPSRTLESYF